MCQKDAVCICYTSSSFLKSLPLSFPPKKYPTYAGIAYRQLAVCYMLTSSRAAQALHIPHSRLASYSFKQLSKIAPWVWNESDLLSFELL
jgi:hypothetical protein